MSHPAPFSKEILAQLSALTKDWEGPILDPYAGTGLIHEMGRDDTWGIEIEEPWAKMHERTAWGDSTTLTVAPLNPENVSVNGGRSFLPRPHAIVTSPDYGNRFADNYLGTQAEQAERAATGKHPRRRGYALSLNRPVTPGNGAGHYFWSPEYKRIHSDVAIAVTRVMLRPANLALNVSNLFHDGIEHPVVSWWVANFGQRGWVMVDGVPVKTKRYKDGANREARPSSEWIIHMRLP